MRQIAQMKFEKVRYSVYNWGMDITYQRFVERYEAGRVPWGDELPPPEVIELVSKLSPGRALDLGCGYGRSAIYLAQHGWEVDGVDYMPLAIAEAKRRAEASGVNDKTHFHLASITDLGFLTAPYDLAIDVGSMHVLDEAGLHAYWAGLWRLLWPEAIYLLFVHLRRDETPEEERPHGILVETIYRLFGDGFRLERVEYGTTKVEDKPEWASAWFWFRRIEKESG
jgi:SAM-dependent methyltransferase